MFTLIENTKILPHALYLEVLEKLFIRQKLLFTCLQKNQNKKYRSCLNRALVFLSSFSDRNSVGSLQKKEGRSTCYITTLKSFKPSCHLLFTHASSTVYCVF